MGTEVEESSGKGGLRTMPFIIVNESFERVASFGLGANLIVYMMQYYQMSAATVNTILGIWGAFSNGLAIVGAIVSDSYLGRFKVVAIGSISSLIGMIIFWLTAMIPQLTASPCSQLQHICKGATAFQLAVLFSSFVFMSLGPGFVRPVSIIFGADQLEKKDNPESQRLVDSFFNWYYASLGISTIISVTIIAYIQEHYGWNIGFGVPTFLMFISALMFLIGSPLYIKKKPKESLFIGLIQAGVAAFRKRNTSLPSTDCDDFYHRPLESDLLAPSNDFRCLNKACMIQDPQIDLNPDGSASNPWRLCTVEHLESLKALLRSLPICSTGIMIFVTMSQFSYTVLQTAAMDRHIIPQFEIPAASFSVFLIIALTLWITLYDRVLVPLLSKYAGLPRGLSPVFRMGLGLVVSCLSMALSAITESIRRKKAIEQGLEDDPSGFVNMSAMWFVPQYALLGVAEAAYSVGQIEFFYSLFPKSMSSIASSMYTVGYALSGLAVSALVSVVDGLSSTGGKTSWLSSNINSGHLDYYFWLLTILSFLNFLYFLVVRRFYEPSNDGSTQLSYEEKQCDYRLLSES